MAPGPSASLCRSENELWRSRETRKDPGNRIKDGTADHAALNKMKDYGLGGC